MLEIRNLSKSFRHFPVLEDINVTLDHGVYGLLSPNGAGKTTLIKMLVTLLSPTTGEILWDGEDITLLDDRYREQIGYLPQKFGYYREDTPTRFLIYMAALNGIGKETARARSEELLALVGLSEAKNRKMKKFSGGMLQRVGIANALMNDPALVIFDEPTAGLDPMERVRFRNILAKLGETRTVILSTHIVSDIENIADKVMMIKDHHLLYCDTIDRICRDTHTEHLEDAFMKIYGGDRECV